MKPATLVLLIGSAIAVGCHRGGQPTSVSSSLSEPMPVRAAGLHNVYRVADKLLSGSSPEGDDGFRALQQLGVRTIISVDGSRPDVELARKYGLRYVHLPIAYDGVPAEQGRRIARAVRDLPGLVYIHCHHGKHRGPAAAAVACLCLDGSCPAGSAITWLRQAGTDPHYTGLYSTVGQFRRPLPNELDLVSADFPEVAGVPALAQMMVNVDATWDRLKQLRSAGWKTPPGHADLDPPHEALQLREHYREASRLPDVKQRPKEFIDWLREAEQAAKDLETALRVEKDGPAINKDTAEQAFRRSAEGCTRCHGKYRDVPKKQ
jgi:hypothetical protein